MNAMALANTGLTPASSHSSALHWQRRLSRIFGDVVIDCASQPLQLGHVHYRFGASDFLIGEGPPLRLRKPSSASPDKDALVCAFMVEAGRVHIRHCSQSYEVGPGQIAIFTQSRELMFDYATQYRINSLLLPRSALGAVSSEAIARLNCATDTDTGAARIFSLLLRDIPDHVAGLNRAEIDDSDALIKALGHALGQLADRESGIVHDDGRLVRALRFIRARCTDEDLTRDQVAAHVGVSIRTLNRLLGQQGESLASLIVKTRLTLAKRMLSDADRDDVSIAVIAYDAGFADPTNFSRLFKQKYGLPPARYRASQRTDANA